MLKRLIHEPLVHFLGLALIIFAVYSALNAHAFASKPRIEIDATRLEQLSGLFMRTWQRRPTAEELKGLVDDYVKTEIYYHEAKKLGLDANDAVVRQRMRLKMDMLNDVAVDRLSPSDDELNAYLGAHADEFRSEPAAAFEQVFLSPDKRGASLDAAAATLLAELRARETTDVANLGDVTQLPAKAPLTARSGIAHDFGAEFAAAVINLPVGSWSGPIRSGYGVHLVKVNARNDGLAPPLADIRDGVLSEWRREMRKALADQRLADYARNYDIVVTGPGASGLEQHR